MGQDELLHKLQTHEEKIKELVNKYPNDMQLGEKIRRFVQEELING